MEDTVRFEIKNDPVRVGEHCFSVAAFLHIQAHRLLQSQPTWIHDNHLQGSIVGKSVHDPFIHFLIKWSDYEDQDPKLASDWAGFGLVGPLPLVRSRLEDSLEEKITLPLR